MVLLDRIYEQATRGTAYNKGLPPVLSSLVAAQAAHETGNFTSRFFTDYNNAFGYSYVPGGIYQLDIPGDFSTNGQPVAKYRSIEDSTKEIVDWIYRRIKEGKFPADLRTIQTPEQYAALLKDANYFEDSISNYAAGIKRFFVQVIELAGKPAAGILLLALGAAAYWYYTKKKK